MSRPLARRGQNLVLMALTMLLVTLMVMVTLGISQRVRENHELQNVADMAAYSTAVMNARAYNAISIVNRLEVSFWVAQAADQSLISWASYARGLINEGQVLLDYVKGQAQANPADVDVDGDGIPDANSCSGMANNAQAAWDMLDVRRRAMVSAWQGLDVPAGNESRDIQGTIGMLRGYTRSGPGGPWRCVGYRGACGQLFEDLDAQRLVWAIVGNAGVQSVAILPRGGKVSNEEVDCTKRVGGLCPLDSSWNDNMWDAAMGSRGNSFVTSRGIEPPRVRAAFSAVTAAYPEFNFGPGAPTGSAYWSASTGGPLSPPHPERFNSTVAWGDDHGTLQLVASGGGNCNFTTPAFPVLAGVRSTHIDDGSDQHQWLPTYNNALGTNVDNTDPTDVHTMGSCQPLCPSVWVRAVGWRPGGGAQDAYGVPKSMVVLERDLTTLERPWDLNFRFGFKQGAPTTGFDNRGEVAAGVDISKARVVGTGITYYHRQWHWQEHPNLLNPFWRATLAPSNVDLQGNPAATNPTDLESAATPAGRTTYRALVNAGYKGFN